MSRTPGGATVIGPVPPPVTGAATITALAARQLSDHVETMLLATSTDETGSTYHLRRARRYARAVGVLLRAPAGLAVYVSAQAGRGRVYDIGVCAVALVKRHRLVLHHHATSYLGTKSALTSVLFWLVRKGGGAHVFLCECMRRSASDNYGEFVSEVISNRAFLPAPTGSVREPVERDRWRVGFLGNLSAEKGVDLAVRAVQGAAAIVDTPIELLVAGPVRDEDVRRELRSPLVRHLGAVDEATKERFFAQIDVLVFPSRYRHEAEPLVVIEAVDRGVPVLASDVGCLPELLGEAGSCEVLSVERWGDAAPQMLVDSLKGARAERSPSGARAPLWRTGNGRETEGGALLWRLLAPLGPESGPRSW